MMGLEKIAEYKKQMYMTTEELSRRSGVPVGTLNKILNGQTKDPKIKTVKAIARVLNCTLNDFDDMQEDNICEEIEQLIVRNAARLSKEQKMHLIDLLYKI